MAADLRRSQLGGATAGRRGRRPRRRARRSKRGRQGESVSAPILVVDDDDVTRCAVSEILASAGFAPECAIDGRAALRMLQDGFRPRLILLDLAMPGGHGTTFRCRQRDDPQLRHIPIVLFSGEGDLAAWAQRLEADAYLLKPIDIDRLLETIRRVLGSSPGPAPS